MSLVLGCLPSLEAEAHCGAAPIFVCLGRLVPRDDTFAERRPCPEPLREPKPREHACAAKSPNASVPIEYSLDFSTGVRKVGTTKSVQWAHAPENLLWPSNTRPVPLGYDVCRRSNGRARLVSAPAWQAWHSKCVRSLASQWKIQWNYTWNRVDPYLDYYSTTIQLIRTLRLTTRLTLSWTLIKQTT